MSRGRVDALLQAAIAEGLVPADAVAVAQQIRPWPVVLLTALGAWLAALPLLAAVALQFSDLLQTSAGPYVVGLTLIIASVLALRARNLPLFLEQLAVPMLLVGCGALAYALSRDLPTRAAALLMSALVCSLAFAIAIPWLRVLLGAAAAMLLTLFWIPGTALQQELSSLLLSWLAWHLNLGLWLGANRIQRLLLAREGGARHAATLENVRAGWLLATLAGLAFWSGMTLLVGASAGPFAWIANSIGGAAAGQAGLRAIQVASFALAALAAVWAAARWPEVRALASAGAAAVVVALAGFMPALGAVLLALSVCLTSGRLRLAGAAALAAAWIIGGFYYQLAWPLQTKSAVLVGAGILLAALAWLAAFRAVPSVARSSSEPARLRSGAGIALTALAAMATANVGIWQKEDLISRGQSAFVELAPVDPRSLLQGDFMRLNFRLPQSAQLQQRSRALSGRPHVVARRDARNVATLLRIDDGTVLAADEFRIELTPKGDGWTLVTDAWFFQEGEAARWEKAKYGEFRVDSAGRALLVGLRGADLKPL